MKTFRGVQIWQPRVVDIPTAVKAVAVVVWPRGPYPSLKERRAGLRRYARKLAALLGLPLILPSPLSSHVSVKSMISDTVMYEPMHL